MPDDGPLNVTLHGEGFFGTGFLLIALLNAATGAPIQAAGFFIAAMGFFLPFEWNAHPDRYPDHLLDHWYDYVFVVQILGIAIAMYPVVEFFA